MDEDDKIGDLLRNTVKSDIGTEKSGNSTKKTIIITIVIVSIILVALGITLFFVLRDNDTDEGSGKNTDSDSDTGSDSDSDIESDSDSHKEDVIDGLLERQFPEIKDRFEFKIEESDQTFFEISTSGTDPLQTKIIIKGNNKLSISSGIGYYLRYHALSQISWTGDSLKNRKNKKLPPLKEPIKKISKLQYSYYMNTCTHS